MTTETSTGKQKRVFIHPLNHTCRIALYNVGNHQNILEPTGAASEHHCVDKNGNPMGSFLLTWITRKAMNKFCRRRLKSGYMFRRFEEGTDGRIHLVAEYLTVMPKSLFKHDKKKRPRSKVRRRFIVNV